MADFIWTATDVNGKIIKGQLSSGSTATVKTFLRNQKLIPLSVKEKQKSVDISKVGSIGKVRLVDKMLFTEHMAVMVKAGISLLEAIDILFEETPKNSKMNEVLVTIKGHLQNGQPLVTGLKQYPKVFNRTYVGLVEAGEKTGNLAESFENLYQQLEKEHDLRGKIRAVMAYPIVLVITMFAVILLLVTFVLPRLVTVFITVNVKLPWTTRLLLGVTNYASTHKLLVFSVFIITLVTIAGIGRKQKVRDKVTHWLFKVPKLGPLLHNIQIARLTRTLAVSLKSGVSIIQAVELAAISLTGSYQVALKRAADDLTKGVTLSETLRHYPKLFPSIMLGMLKVGEKSGQMDSVLADTADYYDSEIDSTLKEVASFIEPMLLVVLGLIIGFIAIAVITPIYSLVSSF